ncbi:MAG: tetratricopeptide repeat protein [Myxococcales bacterium]|nr:tetratricopeptide repeat protein [Myxococcales bacterium]
MNWRHSKRALARGLLIALLSLAFVGSAVSAKRKKPSQPVKSSDDRASFIETRIATLRLVSSGQTQRAIELWQRFVDRHPRYVAARLQLAKMHAEYGSDAQAMDEFEQVIALDASTSSAYLALVQLYRKSKEPQRAIRLLRSGLTRVASIGREKLQLRLAVLLFEAERVGEARRLLQDLLRRDPRMTQAQLYLGHLELDAGHYLEAAKHYGVVLASPAYLFPHLVAMYRTQALAGLYREARLVGDDDKIRGYYSLYRSQLAKALVQPLQLALEHHRLANTYSAIGDYRRALRHYEKALELDPTDSATLNNLAWNLATALEPELRDPARALRYAERCLELSHWRNAHNIETYAEVLFQNGRGLDALRIIRRARVRQPHSAYFRRQERRFRRYRLGYPVAERFRTHRWRLSEAQYDP